MRARYLCQWKKVGSMLAMVIFLERKGADPDPLEPGTIAQSSSLNPLSGCTRTSCDKDADDAGCKEKQKKNE